MTFVFKLGFIDAIPWIKEYFGTSAFILSGFIFVLAYGYNKTQSVNHSFDHELQKSLLKVKSKIIFFYYNKMHFHMRSFQILLHI